MPTQDLMDQPVPEVVFRRGRCAAVERFPVTLQGLPVELQLELHCLGELFVIVVHKHSTLRIFLIHLETIFSKFFFVELKIKNPSLPSVLRVSLV
jgi:virulence-associated protein VagC